MRNTRRILFTCLGAGIFAMVALAFGLFTSTTHSVRAADANSPPFDFSDQFYLSNGINPAAIRERAGNPDRNPTHWVVDNSNTDPNRRGIRILETTGGFNNSGSLIYYSIMGVMPNPDVFTNDAAGVQAQEIANSFRAFLFPKTPRNADCSPGNVILSPAPSNRRQDNVFDTRNGYFSNNPLGLWILAFAVFTKDAFTVTPSGCQLIPQLADIAARNGTDLDGTPILTTADGIDGLVSHGLVEIRNRPLNGTAGFPWVI